MEDKIATKSLEELENNRWNAPKEYPSKLVRDVYELRKKRIIDFNANDFRVLIDQNEGIGYIIPYAINLLKKDILIDSLYYPGDLLMSILNIDKNYWSKNEEVSKNFHSLLKDSIGKISESEDIDDDTLRDEMLESINKFLSTNFER